LGLDAADLAITGLPCEVVSTGLPCHIVPIGSLSAMARIQVRPDKLAEIGRALGFGDLFVFTLETSDAQLTRIVCEQGLEMGRPSRILVDVERAGETITAVRVGGSAVVVGEGALRAPGSLASLSAVPPLG
jgi:trans-2,3-dihydro-3-hydroxyanthranilate isomerase